MSVLHKWCGAHQTSKHLPKPNLKSIGNRFRTNLDPFVGVFRLPSGNNNEGFFSIFYYNFFLTVFHAPFL